MLGRRERILKAVKLVIACAATERWEIRETIRQSRGPKLPSAVEPAAVSVVAEVPLSEASAAILQQFAGKARR